MGWACPSCGKQNEADAKFCVFCGKDKDVADGNPESLTETIRKTDAKYKSKRAILPIKSQWATGDANAVYAITNRINILGKR